ncbi:PREDICTED: 39S ribosomal protein L52, mitochondrial [Nanorana parkeri]|uniref:39S ribosomal protein L52, mitochondrial n=1 Tax=Nanorana parkeri TaxID=125878 RepID=UPI000854229F|nr:PREDICTED: 39S ribosomal protein L52, mitochondrial [Nanorana parkeri]
MAAPLLVACMQRGLYRTSVSCTFKRSLQNSAVLCAGQDWRKQHGFARSDSEYGPLTDLPDWSFVDGRPAPLWKGQIRRIEENKALASRVVVLSNEIDEGMKKWSEKQEDLNHQKLLKQKTKLKSKALFNKAPSCK